MTDSTHTAACLPSMLAWQVGWFAPCWFLISKIKIP